MEGSRGCSRTQTAIVTAPRMQTPAPHVLGEIEPPLAQYRYPSTNFEWLSMTGGCAVADQSYIQIPTLPL